MKIRLILIIAGLIILAIASIARLVRSDFLQGSASDIMITFGLAGLGLAAIFLFAIKSVKKKLRYVQEARTTYQAAYMCMIESDPINTYMIVSTATELKILTNDKKQTPVVELKKEYVTIAISDSMIRGIRKVKGISISTNTKVAESLNGQSYSTNIILLDDTKLMTPPLSEDAVSNALLKLQ